MAGTKLTRSQVAQLLGVTPKTLYTWEKEGRTEPPERDWRGWRWYTASQVEALRRIVGAGVDSADVGVPVSPTESASLPSSRGEPPAATAETRAALPALDISARNRLVGTVKSISSDGVLAEVVLDLGGGNEIVSVITRTSVERLGLQVGTRAIALIKATEVLLAREAV